MKPISIMKILNESVDLNDQFTSALNSFTTGVFEWSTVGGDVSLDYYNASIEQLYDVFLDHYDDMPEYKDLSKEQKEQFSNAVDSVKSDIRDEYIETYNEDPDQSVEDEKPSKGRLSKAKLESARKKENELIQSLGMDPSKFNREAISSGSHFQYYTIVDDATEDLCIEFSSRTLSDKDMSDLLVSIRIGSVSKEDYEKYHIKEALDVLLKYYEGRGSYMKDARDNVKKVLHDGELKPGNFVIYESFQYPTRSNSDEEEVKKLCKIYK